MWFHQLSLSPKASFPGSSSRLILSCELQLLWILKLSSQAPLTAHVSGTPSKQSNFLCSMALLITHLASTYVSSNLRFVAKIKCQTPSNQESESEWNRCSQCIIFQRSSSSEIMPIRVVQKVRKVKLFVPTYSSCEMIQSKFYLQLLASINSAMAPYRKGKWVFFFLSRSVPLLPRELFINSKLSQAHYPVLQKRLHYFFACCIA